MTQKYKLEGTNFPSARPPAAGPVLVGNPGVLLRVLKVSQGLASALGKIPPPPRSLALKPP